MVAIEDSGGRELGRQVQSRLSAEGRQQCVRPLARDHALDRLDRERLEIDAVGDLFVGHDRRRVGVHEDRLDALLPQRLAGLRPGVIELGGLADHDWA